MDLQPVSGQLYIRDGEIQETQITPGLLAVAPPKKVARGREKDFLFAHLYMSGNERDQDILIQDVLETIRDRFYQNSGSVTASLRQAILDANQLLLRLNLNAPGPSYQAHLTCVVQRSQELFWAQAGNSIAFLGQQRTIEPFPNKKPDRITPLGETAGPDIRYYHSWIQDQSRILLLPIATPELNIERLQQLLLQTPLEDSLTLLIDHTGENSTRLLIIEFIADELATVSEYTPSTTAEYLPLPTSSPKRDGAKQVARTLPNIPIEETARTIGSKTAYGLSALTGGLANLMAKLRPPKNSPEAEEESIWAWSAVLAIIIPIIVAVIVTGVYFELGRVNRFSALKQEIRESFSAAQSAGDDQSLAREEYLKIITLSKEAETLYPNDNDVTYYRTQTNQALDRMDDVTRLNSYLIHQFDTTASLTSLILRPGEDGDIYVLDEQMNRISRIATDASYMTKDNPNITVVVETKQIINQPLTTGGTYVVGQPVDMVWREANRNNNRDQLTILDKRGALINYYPSFNDLQVIPLDAVAEWQQPTELATFEDRLYILDAQGFKIWRYYPDGNGYQMVEGQETIAFYENPDLPNVIDLDIYQEDGSVILLYNDGRLRRYVNGRLLWDETDLLQNGLDKPMISSNHVMIVGRGLNSYILVSDPGTNRIIQFSLGGRYLAQFKTDNDAGNELFLHLRDFVVLDEPLRIFFVTDTALYAAKQD